MGDNSGIEVAVDGHLVRPHFQVGESLAGYLLRFAQRNMLFGLRGLASTHGMSPQQLLLADRGDLMRKLWGAQWATRPDAALFQSAPQPILGAHSAPTRICPECLRESKVKIGRAAWDRPMSLVCGKHRLMLRDRCHECGEQLDYLTRRCVHVCRCGADLTNQPAQPPSESLACIEWVYSATTPGADERESTEEAAARSIIRMASHLRGGPKVARNKFRVGEPFVTSDVLKEVDPWFQAWPDGFTQAIEKVGWTTSALRSEQRRSYLRAQRFPRIDEAFDATRRTSKRIKETTPTDKQITTLKFPRALIPLPRACVARPQPAQAASGEPPRRSRAKRSALATVGDSRPDPAETEPSWPSGGLPVLLLAFLATQVESTNSTVVGVDRGSLRGIFDLLGVNLSPGGQMAPFARVQSALKSMGAASLSWANERVAASSDYSDEASARRLFSNTTSVEGQLKSVVLSQWFQDECKSNSIDLSIEALRKLKGSSIALGLYLTLRERAVSGMSAGFIPWADLNEYVGSTAQRERRLRETVQQATSSFDLACPNASVCTERSGLRYKLAPRFASQGR